MRQLRKNGNGLFCQSVGSPPVNVLIIALAGIGDALMFTPALTMLKKHSPNARLTALVMFKGVEDIYLRSGLFEKVIRFDFLKEGALRSLRFVAGLRGTFSHSVTVYPANRVEYNGIAFLAGARHRGAVAYTRMDGRNLGWLNNSRVPEDDARHNVQTNLLLVKTMFGITDNSEPDLCFPLTDADNGFADAFIAGAGINSGTPLIGMHPGCSTLKNHIRRRWAPERFAALADRLSGEYNAKVLVFGGPDEAELKAQVLGAVNNTGAVMAVDAPNLGASAALIKKCDLFVTNDSSLMHVAAAMQRKVIPIIGPTNLAYIYPWNTEYKTVTLNLPCAPCFFYSPKPLACSRQDVQFKCIEHLQVEQVITVCREMLTK